MVALISPALNLGILIVILAYALRAPVKNQVFQRRQEIEEGIRQTREQFQLAQGRYEEFTSKLKAIETEISAMRQQYLLDSQSLKTKIISHSQRLAKTIREDAQGLIQGLHQELIRDLRQEVVRKVIVRAQERICTHLTGEVKSQIRIAGGEALMSQRIL